MTHGLRWRSEADRPGRSGLAELGDEALLGLARAGDTAAFAELYQRHRVAARRLARRLVHGRVEADDVVAETFVRVLRVLRRGGGPVDGFRVYLLTAVRRTAWYLQNKDSRELAVDGAELDRVAGGPDFESAAAERGLMSRAFASLPVRWRTVLWHTDVEGEPARQVARILGISPNGVAALTYRARGALTAAYLQAHLSEPPSAGCRPFAAKLGGYTADRGRPGPGERDRIAAHLAACADCRARVAELRDVRSSLRAAAGPLLLGPVAASYLAPGKLAVAVGAMVQHGKVTAAATLTGAAASGEAVAHLMSHHGKAGAALAGVTLTVAGALGLAATGGSIPEATSQPVVVTAAGPDPATSSAAGSGSTAGPRGGARSAPAVPGASRAVPPGQPGSGLPLGGSTSGNTPQPSGTPAGGGSVATSSAPDSGSPASGSSTPTRAAGGRHTSGAGDPTASPTTTESTGTVQPTSSATSAPATSTDPTATSGPAAPTAAVPTPRNVR
jgi:RNA polymerase sigma factor (sigma-70 family)